MACTAAAAAVATVVCSMCGDVGFPEKLFRCARCRHRFQHSYCTNYYDDRAPAPAGPDMCDWCLSDVAGKQQAARWSAASSPAGKQNATDGSQESSTTTTTSSGGSGSGRGGAGAKASGAGAKASGAGDQQAAAEVGRRATTRAAGRRYKLLKDVLCE